MCPKRDSYLATVFRGNHRIVDRRIHVQVFRYYFSINPWVPEFIRLQMSKLMGLRCLRKIYRLQSLLAGMYKFTP